MRAPHSQQWRKRIKNRTTSYVSSQHHLSQEYLQRNFTVPLFDPTGQWEIKEREKTAASTRGGKRDIKREIRRERAGLKVTAHCPNSSFKTVKEAKNTAASVSPHVSFILTQSLYSLSIPTIFMDKG